MLVLGFDNFFAILQFVYIDPFCHTRVCIWLSGFLWLGEVCIYF